MKTKEYFLHLLSSYINNNPPMEENSIDWNEILYLAQIHSVQSIIYISINKLKNKPPIYDKLKELFYISVNLSITQDVLMKNVIDALTENGIDHMLMKGYILKNYYPDKEARTFGDIDFLIDERDREKCDAVLKNIGFEFVEEEYVKEVWVYRKRQVTLEVHTEIIYEKLFFDIDYRNFFHDKVKNKQLIADNTYELKKEDHFIYLLVHLAKHFYNAGVGIRMFMDIAVMLNKFGKELDCKYIYTEIEKLRLTKFANIVYFICKKYFNSNIDCRDITRNEENIIMAYILDHGIFGFENKDYFDILYHKNDDSKLSTIRKRLFPDYEYMKGHNKWFYNGKRIMLPYAWSRRLLGHLLKKNKRKEIIDKLNVAIKCGNDFQKHNNILNMVGLK